MTMTMLLISCLANNIFHSVDLAITMTMLLISCLANNIFHSIDLAMTMTMLLISCLETISWKFLLTFNYDYDCADFEIKCYP